MEAGEEVLVVNLKGRSVDKREFHMGLLDGEYVVEKGNDRLCLIWNALQITKCVLGAMKKFKEKRFPGWPIAQGSENDEAKSE